MKAKRVLGIVATVALSVSTVLGPAMPVFADEVDGAAVVDTQGAAVEETSAPAPDSTSEQVAVDPVQLTEPAAVTETVESPVTDPASADPAATEPAAVEPVSTEPAVSEPVTDIPEEESIEENPQEEATEEDTEEETAGTPDFLSESKTINDATDINMQLFALQSPEAGIAEESLENSDPANESLPAYTPITIDGDFTDWEGHQTTAVNDGKLSDMDMVWSEDGGLCIYLKEADGQWHGIASNTGERSNGQYVITSDTGRQFVFQLKYENGKVWAEDGKGNKLDGVTVVCKEGQTNDENGQYNPTGNQYEIKLDPGVFKTYNQSVSLGYYLAKDQSMIVSDVANPYIAEQTQAGELVADGNFGDWDHYSHELIEYSKAYADSEGALYSDGDTLLMHVATYKDQKVTNFYNDITVRFNEDDNQRVNLKLAVADEAGNLSYPNDLWDSTPGKTYTYYLIDENGWNLWSGIDKNINSDTFGYGNGAKQQWLYGKIIVKVTATGTEMEVESDLAEYADRLNLDRTSLKRIEAQFENIGQTWISCAGTSTGPIPGILMGVGVVAFAAWGLKKKEEGMPKAPEN